MKATLVITYNGEGCEPGCKHELCYVDEVLVGSLYDLEDVEDVKVIEVTK